MYDWKKLPWRDKNTIEFPKVSVELCLPPELYERESTDQNFILGKSPRMLERLIDALPVAPRRIVDVGIYKGGSVVFYNEAFSPEKLVALDISPQVCAPLQRYAESSAGRSVSLYPGTDQADRSRLAEICAAEFGDAKIDLVVDDASHLYHPTRETFRELFPILAPGGLYVIEDWGWAHWEGDFWQKERGGDFFRQQLPLSNLLLELMLLSASAPAIVKSVEVSASLIYVRRGSARLEPGFDPAQFVLNRGEPIPIIGAKPQPPRPDLTTMRMYKFV